jgi:hypothetical protein
MKKMIIKSEKREKRKKRRKFSIHGRRLAEIIRNAVAKRNAKSTAGSIDK